MEVSRLSRASLAELRRDLKAIGPAWPKEVAKVNRVVADKGAARARGKAEGLGGVWRRNASAIKARATQTFGAVSVRPATGTRSTTRGAAAAFWGSDKRSGWYANDAHAGRDGKPQNPKWVGNSWEPGVRGQGPYALNDALAELGPELLEDWGHGIDEVTRRAFPSR